MDTSAPEKSQGPAVTTGKASNRISALAEQVFGPASGKKVSLVLLGPSGFGFPLIDNQKDSDAILVIHLKLVDEPKRLHLHLQWHIERSQDSSGLLQALELVPVQIDNSKPLSLSR